MPLKYARIVEEALALPEVVESTSYGTPSLKLREKMMVRLKEDAQTIVLRCAWEDRERLLAVYPDVFLLTDHYRNYPLVLVHLPHATLSLLRPALRAAWRLCATRTLLKAHPALAQDTGAVP